jgi:hypothetical protein
LERLGDDKFQGNNEIKTREFYENRELENYKDIKKRR